MTTLQEHYNKDDDKPASSPPIYTAGTVDGVVVLPQEADDEAPAQVLMGTAEEGPQGYETSGGSYEDDHRDREEGKGGGCGTCGLSFLVCCLLVCCCCLLPAIILPIYFLVIAADTVEKVVNDLDDNIFNFTDGD